MPSEPRPARDVLQREIGVELRRGRPRARTPGEPQERLHLGGERERAVREASSRRAASCRRGRGRARVARARASQSASANMPGRRSTNSSRALRRGAARPACRRCRGRRARGGELGAQLAEVVELAVEDGDDVAGLVRHRLAARLEVDHPQAPVAERAAAEGVDGALVGAAMDERCVHAGDERRDRPSRTLLEVRRCRTSSSKRYAVVSCHVERPLDDACWSRFSRSAGPAPGRLPDRSADTTPRCGRRRGRGSAGSSGRAGRPSKGRSASTPTSSLPGMHGRQNPGPSTPSACGSEAGWLRESRSRAWRSSAAAAGTWTRALAETLSPSSATPTARRPPSGRPTSRRARRGSRPPTRRGSPCRAERACSSSPRRTRSAWPPGLRSAVARAATVVHVYFHDTDLLSAAATARSSSPCAVLGRRRRADRPRTSLPTRLATAGRVPVRGVSSTVGLRRCGASNMNVSVATKPASLGGAGDPPPESDPSAASVGDIRRGGRILVPVACSGLLVLRLVSVSPLIGTRSLRRRPRPLRGARSCARSTTARRRSSGACSGTRRPTGSRSCCS